MNALKKGLAALVALVAVLAAVLLAWGLAEPYFIDDEAHVAALPNLPADWEGQEFALLADWQVGARMGNTSTIRRAVERLVEDPPAFVLVAGDFVYHTAIGRQDEVERVAALLRPLPEAGVPVYAVLGNHDYGMQKPDGRADTALARRVAEALEGAGVHVLENESAALAAPGGNARGSNAGGGNAGGGNAPSALHLVGVAPRWPGRADPEAALAEVPEGAARLVLMHNPDTFARIRAGAAPVALAGHTHGGQVALPLLPESTWMSYFKADAVHADGWIAPGYGQGQNRLYVNRGIGFSLAPLRIGAMPEVTRFTLQSP